MLIEGAYNAPGASAGKLVPLAVNSDGTLRRPPVLVMQTDKSAVAAGAGPGWVSGSIANLAVAATVDCLFDLGPAWDQYVRLDVLIDPGTLNLTSTGTVMRPSMSADGVDWMRVGAVNGTAGFSINGSVGPLLGSAGIQFVQLRPHGRYLQCTVLGTTTNALGATARLRVVLYPD